MSRKAEHICIGGLVLQTLCALGCFVLAPLTSSRAVFAQAWQFALGIGVWLVALLHLSFRRAAAEERLDEEAIRRRQGERAEGIFGPEGAADEFSAQARLVRVEKWLVPIGSLVFGIAMVIVSVLMASGWGKPAARVMNPLAGMTGFGAIVFLTFIMGRYTIGESQEAGSELLRGPGGYMLFNTLCSGLVVIGLTFAHFGSWGVERVVAWFVIVALGLIGAELTLMFVVNLYRPRLAARAPRAPYDSRVLGLLSMPKRILRSAAETLDYQFGFKVSETWFFQFLGRALAPLILFGLVTLYLLTCFLVVPAGDLAFIERFGRPRTVTDASGEQAPKVYGPGMHLKWPLGIESARVVPANRVQQIMLGVAGKETGVEEVEKARARGEKRELPPFLWTNRHFEQEYMLLVASAQKRGAAVPEGEEPEGPPVSLLVVGVPVQFKVRPDELYRYVYSYVDVTAALEAVAYRQLVQYVAGVDLIRILGPDRQKAGQDLQRLIQQAANDAGLGVDIVFVGLHGVHPPAGVAASFEARVSALQEREAAILEAEAYRIETIPNSRAKAKTKIMAGKGDRFAKRAQARKNATRFAGLLKAYDQDVDDPKLAAAARHVFVVRWYADRIEEVLKGRRLVFAPPKTAEHEVVVIDLMEKLGRELVQGFGQEIESLEKGTK
jgi:membrane protease subunit HflK